MIRGRCPYCGRRVATRIPKGGDGSLRVAVKHGRPDPMNTKSKCPGSGEPVKEWCDE